MQDIIMKKLKSGGWETMTDLELFGHHIPKGFKTDGLSIPWWARWLVDPVGKGLAAGLVHDHQLSANGMYVNERKSADKLIYRNLRDCGFSRLRAWLCYAGTRVGSLLPFLRPNPA